MPTRVQEPSVLYWGTLKQKQIEKSFSEGYFRYYSIRDWPERLGWVFFLLNHKNWFQITDKILRYSSSRYCSSWESNWFQVLEYIAKSNIISSKYSDIIFFMFTVLLTNSSFWPTRTLLVYLDMEIILNISLTHSKNKCRNCRHSFLLFFFWNYTVRSGKDKQESFYTNVNRLSNKAHILYL